MALDVIVMDKKNKNGKNGKKIPFIKFDNFVYLNKQIVNLPSIGKSIKYIEEVSNCILILNNLNELFIIDFYNKYPKFKRLKLFKENFNVYKFQFLIKEVLDIKDNDIILQGIYNDIIIINISNNFDYFIEHDINFINCISKTHHQYYLENDVFKKLKYHLPNSVSIVHVDIDKVYNIKNSNFILMLTKNKTLIIYDDNKNKIIIIEKDIGFNIKDVVNINNKILLLTEDSKCYELTENFELKLFLEYCDKIKYYNGYYYVYYKDNKHNEFVKLINVNTNKVEKTYNEVKDMEIIGGDLYILTNTNNVVLIK